MNEEKGFPFFLTDDVVREAVDRVMEMVKALREAGKEEYLAKYFVISVRCGVISKTIALGSPDKNDKNSGEYWGWAIEKAEAAYELKKSLNDDGMMFSIRKNDPIWMGGVYSKILNLGIGVSGFNKAETDDAVARHVIVEIKHLIRLDWRQLVIEKLRPEEKFYLSR